jgi:hypothetical protein
MELNQISHHIRFIAPEVHKAEASRYREDKRKPTRGRLSSSEGFAINFLTNYVSVVFRRA